MLDNNHVYTCFGFNIFIFRHGMEEFRDTP